MKSNVNLGKQVSDILSQSVQQEVVEETPAEEEENLLEGEVKDENLEAELEDEEQGAETDEDEEQEETPSDEAETITTINQLADALESEESAIYGLEVPMGDGLEPVSISKLKDSYMNLSRDRQQLENERQNLMGEVQQKAQEMMILPQLSQETMEAMSKVRAIESAYNSFDWGTLEQENPSQAVLQRQKFQDAYATAVNEYNQLYEAGQQEANRQAANTANKEKQETLRFIPEWSDVKVASEELGQIEKMMTSYGFSQSEFKGITDHRVFRITRDFVKLKEMAEKASVAKKELKTKPRTLRAGSVKTAATQKRLALGKKIKQAKQSTDNRQKAAVISELIS